MICIKCDLVETTYESVLFKANSLKVGKTWVLCLDNKVNLGVFGALPAGVIRTCNSERF